MYIEKIKSPADLKKLDLKELQVVADETRQAVLNRVSKHGGHVGPNLGFVEATVALHYVFNAPKDKLVFDVSHQCYPHKVLTGRAAGFLGDVDDMNAISGYSSPAECPEYDNFEVGHTSTSVSLATGLQKARDVKGTDENIIAIIGDGSLSGGEAFEGLDEASELGTSVGATSGRIPSAFLLGREPSSKLKGIPQCQASLLLRAQLVQGVGL